ncbi:MAG: prepilin-type N-terminal cleavage/methylation domain-containing protein [Gammaproteobacteria bacterium]|nr:prepilin-type N-terminal cleavage/methylation domain-containing protein [Gammaproteobacteria bacterium]
MQRYSYKMSHRKNCGLTLIELLIAMLLSSLILLMAYSLLNYQQHYFQQHTQQIHLDQNKRFVQFILSTAIRQAGSFGCRPLANSKVNNTSVFHKKKLVAIFAYQAIGNAWLPSLPKTIKAKHGTDVLAIIYMAPHTAMVATAMSTPNEVITTTDTSLFKQEDLAVISDCEQADIFAISHINGSKKQLKPTTILSKCYAPPAEVGELLYYLFYIQPDDTLYMLDNSKIPEELVDHVSDLQLQFSTHASPNNYVTANGINHWSQVHSVKVELGFDSKNQAAEHYSFITSLRNQ